jgi:hypothetical protein
MLKKPANEEMAVGMVLFPTTQGMLSYTSILFVAVQIAWRTPNPIAIFPRLRHKDSPVIFCRPLQILWRQTSLSKRRRSRSAAGVRVSSDDIDASPFTSKSIMRERRDGAIVYCCKHR